MADLADISGENDFSIESLHTHRSAQKTIEIPRGKCRFCTEPLKADPKTKLTPLYCDKECRIGFEHEEEVKRKTGRK